MTPYEVSEKNGDRRLWVDRRRFRYTVHMPERRSLQDRRCGADRRVETVPRSEIERRAAIR